jgi:hypothetical protein
MATTTILLAADDITKNTLLGGNIDVSRLVPPIKDYQKTRLKELLGKALYNKICADFETQTLSGLYLELYDDIVKELCIHGGTENFLMFGAYMISNNGITKTKTDSSETISKEEVDYIVQASRKLVAHYEDEFRSWIKANPLPEYPLTIKNSNPNIINVGGWVLRKKNC